MIAVGYWQVVRSWRFPLEMGCMLSAQRDSAEKGTAGETEQGFVQLYQYTVLPGFWGGWQGCTWQTVLVQLKL